MDFVQALDPSKLVLCATLLSFALSPFAAPPYNLAIFLFGSYAQDNNEAVQSLQTFTGLLGASALFDVLWMMRNDQNGFIRFLSLLLLLLKIPTFFAFFVSLRERGAHGLSLGGVGLPGATVWAMPGGFTSDARDGYQNVDEEAFVRASRPSAPTPPQAAPASAPGAYQSV